VAGLRAFGQFVLDTEWRSHVHIFSTTALPVLLLPRAVERVGRASGFFFAIESRNRGGLAAIA
jgi:hypothetical protein